MLKSNTITTTSVSRLRGSAALSAAIVGALALATSSPARADAELDALKKQVQDLQQKIDAMAKQQAAAPPAAAAPAPAAPPAVIATASTGNDAISMYGITFSGVLDLGLTYQSYGTPSSDYFVTNLFSFIQKNSSRNIASLSESNISQSNLQLSGNKEIMNGWSGIFRLQTGVNPLYGNISDALKSVTINNGVPCTKVANVINCPQITGADSSLAGEWFNMAAFVGISHKQFGTITAGRQNGIMADGVAKYDPMATSNAFSVIGIAGTAAGGGATENRRLDNSIKYDGVFSGLHVGAQYQFNGTSGQPGSAYEVVFGGVFPHGSIDAIYMKKYDAIAVSPLSVAQVGTLNCPYVSVNPPPADVPATCVGKVGGGGNAMDKSVSATISDNTAWAIMTQYAFDTVKLFASYEHIDSANPKNALPAGTETIGGYILAYVNNAAFPEDRIFQFIWAGAKWSITPKLDWTVAYYRQEQSAYAAANTANAGCNDTRSAQCSGHLNAYSTDVVWKISKRFDGYAGFMWSGLYGGLKNGAMVQNTINPTMGVRLTF
jgi:predicted porin